MQVICICESCSGSTAPTVSRIVGYIWEVTQYDPDIPSLAFLRNVSQSTNVNGTENNLLYVAFPIHKYKSNDTMYEWNVSLCGDRICRVMINSLSTPARRENVVSRVTNASINRQLAWLYMSQYMQLMMGAVHVQWRYIPKHSWEMQLQLQILTIITNLDQRQVLNTQAAFKHQLT